MIASALLPFALDVSISNVLPRRDVNGAILDAHDSKLVLHDGLYHWFAASYGTCKEPSNSRTGCVGGPVGSCGFRQDHNVTLFTSPDLAIWTRVGVVFQAAAALPSQSSLFAPKTIFNPGTHKWVLWFNYIQMNDFGRSYYAVATSEHATGPFRIVNPNVTSLGHVTDNGDLNLFVDDDGTGYIIYTNIHPAHHAMSIERLTPDFTESLGSRASSGIFGERYVEAPMMFRRGAFYYAVFGRCCCYCEAGSVVTVYTSTSPLGPYVQRQSLGSLHSQSTDIFQYKDARGNSQYMYIGDHWQSAPDGIKGHDFTVWAPLFFSADGQNVSTAGFQNAFRVSVWNGSTGKSRIRR